ncbi:MAG: acyl-ACP--UDP-N-acetylglucosamine O-acyltransferase [Gemmatimonadaceae bacterium]
MSATAAVNIHPTAIIHADVKFGDGVSIGPWAIVGPGCVLGDGVTVAARATLEKNVRLGRNVQIGIGSVLGGDPQDLKYRGEDTFVEIGDDTVVREYVTVNRGTSHSVTTRVGSGCFLMTNVHVAHDCQLGNQVIISNGTLLAGHVSLADRVTISGNCAVHQFVRVGRFAFIGGVSKVTQDIPPFVRASGNPTALFGLNSVGLQRNGFDVAVIREVKRAYRLCFKSDLNLSQALKQARTDVEQIPEVSEFLTFIEDSQRGVGF